MELFTVFFFAVFACIIGLGVKRFIDNERSPELTERAVVERKIADTSVDANGVASTSLVIVFRIGEQKLKCAVNGRVYRAMPEHVSGMLTHKGTRFRRFAGDDGTVVEK